MKKCKECGILKDESLFYGFQGECKECSKKRIKISSRNIKKKCLVCGQEFGTCITEINKGGGKFCSRKCLYIYQKNTIRKGKESPCYKEKVITNGYLKIHEPNHKRADNKGLVYEHIIIMEDFIGRELYENEVIHHLDQNKSNNKISNLLLMYKGEHTKLHHFLRRQYNKLNKQDD